MWYKLGYIIIAVFLLLISCSKNEPVPVITGNIVTKPSTPEPTVKEELLVSFNKLSEGEKMLVGNWNLEDDFNGIGEYFFFPDHTFFSTLIDQGTFKSGNPNICLMAKWELNNGFIDISNLKLFTGNPIDDIKLFVKYEVNLRQRFMKFKIENSITEPYRIGAIVDKNLKVVTVELSYYGSELLKYEHDLKKSEIENLSSVEVAKIFETRARDVEKTSLRTKKIDLSIVSFDDLTDDLKKFERFLDLIDWSPYSY